MEKVESQPAQEGSAHGPSSELLHFYRTPAPVTDLAKYATLIDWLTDDIRAIYQVVQGLLIHGGWLGTYGITMQREQTYDTQIAYMTDLLDKALELDPRSLSIPRSPERRVICCCREFATLMCAILRHKGMPARSRCGFATYLAYPGYYEDHWVCEYLDAQEQRWVMVDPQVDPLQQSQLKLHINPLDVNGEQFITAGHAWKMCRTGAVGPDRFGICDDPKPYGLDSLYGLWFARGQLLRDLAALNKVETVPYLVLLEQGRDWCSWRLVGADDASLTADDMALLDRAADVAISATSLPEITALYNDHPDLQPPMAIMAR